MKIVYLNDYYYFKTIELIEKIKNQPLYLGILKNNAIVKGYSFFAEQPIVFKNHFESDLERSLPLKRKEKYLMSCSIFVPTGFSSTFVEVGSILSSEIIPIKEVVLQSKKVP